MFPAHIPSRNTNLRFRELRRPPAPSLATSERRRHQRYPITLLSEYILAGNRAQARTLNISSGGVLLKTDKILSVGNEIQVFINWPVLLDQRCPLHCVISGKVLRSDETGTAIRTIRYDFKIRPKRATLFAV